MVNMMDRVNMGDIMGYGGIWWDMVGYGRIWWDMVGYGRIW